MFRPERSRDNAQCNPSERANNSRRSKLASSAAARVASPDPGATHSPPKFVAPRHSKANAIDQTPRGPWLGGTLERTPSPAERPGDRMGP